MNNKLIIIYLLIIFIVSGCDTTSPFKEESGLHGVVLDANRNNIPGVKVHILYDILETPPDGYYKINYSKSSFNNVNDSLFQNYPNPFNQKTIVNFSISHHSNVKINIVDYITDELLFTFLNEDFDAGIHSIMMSGKMNNGLFKIQMQVDRGGESVFDNYITACRLDVDFDKISAMRPATISNENGEFFIPYDSIPFGAEIIRTTPAGPEPIGFIQVPESVKIVLMHYTYSSLVRTVIFRSDKALHEEFIMGMN